MQPFIYRMLLSALVWLTLGAAATADTGMPANDAVKQADADWARRDEGPALQSALRWYQQALAGATPAEKRALLERLAQGTYLLADNYLPEDSKAQQAYYQTAARFAEACLRLDSNYAKNAEDDIDEAVEDLGKPYVGCLFFKAAADGRDAQITGILKSLSRKPAIDAMIKKAYKLNPAYLDGAPDRYYGVYYSALPGFLGGSKSKSKEHFTRALKTAPDFLDTKVLMAANLYEKGGKQYRQTLNEVVEADPNAAPARYAPENRIAQRKARELLGMGGAT